MGRKTEAVQRNGSKYRMRLYSVRNEDGKIAYAHLGTDETRARQLQPLIAVAVEGCRTVKEAQAIARQIVAAPSVDAAKEILRTVLGGQVYQSVKPREQARADAREKLQDLLRMDDAEFASFERLNPDAVGELKENGIRIRPEVLKRFPRLNLFDPVSSIIKAIEGGNTAPADSGQRKLSACLAEWVKLKTLKNRSTSQINRVTEGFNLFVARTGDIPISELSKSDITRFEEYLWQEQGENGPRWFSHRMGAVGNVLRYVRKKKKDEDEWVFPDGLLDWLDSVDHPEKIQEDPHNKRPMPVATFKALLEKAEEWAGLDPEKWAESQEIPAGQNEAKRRGSLLGIARTYKKIGMQWSAILRFAVNFAAQNEDIGQLERRHLFLDATIPYCQLPRPKTGEHRCTPLLPGTVTALKRWMQYSKITADHVFATRRGERFRSDKVSHGYHDLLNGCKTLPGIEEKLRYDRIDIPEDQRKGWDFKHIRNAGSNLARDHGMRDRVSALLGHVPDKKSADYAYLQTHDEKYLIPVVNLIGQE